MEYSQKPDNRKSTHQERERDSRMSEIAMLVAEEYEKRAKYLEKNGGAVGAEDIGMVSCASQLASRLKEKIADEKKKLVHWVSEFQLEPKSQIGVAASYSFFSA